MKKIIISTIILIVFYMSCTTRSLKHLENNPQCPTSIEGFYHSNKIYTGKVPVLFKKKWDNRSLKVYGNILETTDAGVLFVPEKTGDTTLYNYKEIDALINSNNKLIFGKIPEKYLDECEIKLILLNHSDPDSQLYKIVLEPNEHFGFCLDPGKYQIKYILFKNEHEFIDEAVNFDTLFIDVQEKFNNYLGDLYLDNPDIEGNKIIIPYKNRYNPVAMSGGVAFGVVGAIMGGLSADYVNLKSVHEITVVHNPNFKSLSKIKMKETDIYKK